VFSTPERVDCVREQILNTCKEGQFAVPAGVFMKDHVHLLLEGLAETSDFKRVMALMRQRSAMAFRKRFGDVLWQGGYHERVLRNVDEVPGVIDYIAQNPVREGLAAKSDEYPYLWTPEDVRKARP
jgi:putative transposase